MKNIVWKYVKPLTEQGLVEKFEAQHNVVFPNDLKEVIREHNGGRPSLKYYDLPGEPDREFKCLLSFNPADVETIYKCYPLDSSDASIVPFASDPAGNMFVLKDGKIWLWEHEQDALKFLADSISQFLDALHE